VAESMAELVERMDKELHYPGETLLEQYVPGLDRVADYVVTAVFIVEKQFIKHGPGQGEAKKEEVLTLMYWLWDLAPMPEIIRRFGNPIIHAALPVLVDKVVEWLNAQLPAGEKNLMGLLPRDFQPIEQKALDWFTPVTAA